MWSRWDELSSSLSDRRGFHDRQHTWVPSLCIVVKTEEGADHRRIEVGTAPCADLREHLFLRPPLAIGTVRAQSIPHIRDGEDARRQRDLVALQPLRITCAVPFFMMVVGN